MILWAFGLCVDSRVIMKKRMAFGEGKMSDQFIRWHGKIIKHQTSNRY